MDYFFKLFLYVCAHVVYTTANSIVWKDFLETTPEIYVMKCLWHILFQANAQVRSHRLRLNFLSHPLLGSLPFWPNRLILATNATHEGMLCRASYPSRKVKCQGHKGRLEFLPCPLKALDPFNQFAPNVLQIQYMKEKFAVDNFQVKRPLSRRFEVGWIAAWVSCRHTGLFEW